MALLYSFNLLFFILVIVLGFTALIKFKHEITFLKSLYQASKRYEKKDGDNPNEDHRTRKSTRNKS